MNNFLALNDFQKLILQDGIARNKDEQKEVDLMTSIWNDIKDDKEALSRLLSLICFYHTKISRLKTALDCLCDTCSDCDKFKSVDFEAF